MAISALLAGVLIDGSFHGVVKPRLVLLQLVQLVLSDGLSCLLVEVCLLVILCQLIGRDLV